MRFSTGGACAALLAITLAAGSGGCTSDSPEPPCSQQPQVPVCAPPSVAPSSPSTTDGPKRDVFVRDVSVRRILEVARTQLKTNFEFTFVFAGEVIPCAQGPNAAYSVSGTSSDRAFYCQEGYVAVPGAMAKTFATAPAIGIWYDTARAAANSDPVYAAKPDQGSCAAAFIAAQKLNFTPADGKQLIEVIGGQGSATAARYAQMGLTLASGGKSIDGCKTVRS